MIYILNLDVCFCHVPCNGLKLPERYFFDWNKFDKRFESYQQAYTNLFF